MSDTRAYSAAVQANGTATIRIIPDTASPWVVSQVTVEMKTAPSGAACSIRKNGVLVSPVIPTGDAAAGEPAIPLAPEDEMTVEFTGCTPGDIGIVFVVYDLEGK